MLKKAGILEYEKVHVLNVTNGNRLETYAIASKHKGHICINGAAAHLVSPGDLVIIVWYGQVDIEQASVYVPKIIYVDNKNDIIKKLTAHKNTLLLLFNNLKHNKIKFLLLQHMIFQLLK